MGVLTDNLTDDQLERMMAALEPGYPVPADITEHMMQRITSLEILVLQLEGYVAMLEYRMRKKIV